MGKMVIECLASYVDAFHRSVKNGNDEWQGEWSDRINVITREALPSGSGIDNGCCVELYKSTVDKIVINTKFHHIEQ